MYFMITEDFDRKSDLRPRGRGGLRGTTGGGVGGRGAEVVATHPQRGVASSQRVVR